MIGPEIQPEILQNQGILNMFNYTKSISLSNLIFGHFGGTSSRIEMDRHGVF